MSYNQLCYLYRARSVLLRISTEAVIQSLSLGDLVINSNVDLIVL